MNQSEQRPKASFLIPEQSSGNRWSTGTILVANGLPGIVALAANLVAARQFGPEIFGLWILWRSLTQFLCMDPGFGAALTLTVPKMLAEGNRTEADALQRRVSAFFWWYAIPASVGVLVLWTLLDQWQLNHLLVVALGFGICWTAVTQSMAQSRMNGTAMIAGAIGDTFLCIFSAVMAIFQQFELFLFFQAARLVVRGAIQHFFLRVGQGEVSSVSVVSVLQTGGPVALRGWVGGLSQSGDRILVGAFFGLAATAVSSMGAALATPFLMLSVAMGTVLLPLAVQNPAEAQSNTFRKIKQMLFLPPALAWGLPLLGFIVPWTNGQFLTIGLTLVLLCGLGLQPLLLVPLTATGRANESMVWSLAGITAIVLAFLAGHFLSLGLVLTLGLAGVAVWLVNVGAAFRTFNSKQFLEVSFSFFASTFLAVLICWASGFLPAQLYWLYGAISVLLATVAGAQAIKLFPRQAEAGKAQSE